jgi:ABC-type Mn2+/Zn2+ transport system ATPase subunit
MMASSNPTRGDILISLEDAVFGYGGPPVVSIPELTIRRGDFLGIVGPNGAGKTTLLRGMIGLLKPMAGEVRLHTAKGLRPVLGYVPQVQALDPIFPVTAGEVVAMAAFERTPRLRPIAPEDRDFVNTCLARVGMGAAQKRLFASLSAGQKQRILIARALMTRPDLLLLDEPTSGVDLAAEEAVMELLGELNRQGLAIVFVCHEINRVRENVKEVLWVNRGRIERGCAGKMLSVAGVRERLAAEGGDHA